MKEKGYINKALELLYPPSLYCSCCGNLIDESRTYNLCDHCMSHIRWNADEPREIDGMYTLCCTRYGIYERTLIFALKYNRKTYIARDIAQIMADRLAVEDVRFDVIVPVPLFSGKEKRRGFNQTALIGKHLGSHIKAECLDHGLVRTADTLPMRGLSPTERELNVKGKFALNEKYSGRLKNRNILLIDDFYTTGSTAGECFRALQKAEPGNVWFLAFAAG